MVKAQLRALERKFIKERATIAVTTSSTSSTAGGPRSPRQSPP